MVECTSFPQRSLSLHLVRFAASSTSNPIIFTLSSACLFHVCFCFPRFHCPFPSSIHALFKALSPFFLTTCPYHLTPFVFAIYSNVSFKPSSSISFSLFFLSTNFTSYIDLTMALSVLKIAISFPLNTVFHFHIFTCLPLQSPRFSL